MAIRAACLYLQSAVDEKELGRVGTVDFPDVNCCNNTFSKCKYLELHLPFASMFGMFEMMCGSIVLPPSPQASLSKALSPAIALLSIEMNHVSVIINDMCRIQ